MTVARVNLWGRHIGVVSLDEGERFARFQYRPEFARTKFQIAPLKMPLSDQVYQFTDLKPETFHGLPGLLSDSLPDKFGNRVINRWLAANGRVPQAFNAVERLCYTGTRGMGALEFSPIQGPKRSRGRKIEVEALVELASEVLSTRVDFTDSFEPPARHKALENLLLVGTSAGGARAKVVVAWNPKTNEARSGQVDAGEGFSDWLLKFDGVTGNKDKELDDPKGFGLIEFAYHKMAVAAGITMTECRLLKENGRSHFMTRRFDRLESGAKLHMQSLCAIAHFDFNDPTAYSYEQALLVMRQLDLPTPSLEEQYRRLVFNVVARNQDDHVKNIAFLMNQEGTWSLAPAFDVVYSYNPSSPWTKQHQMSINGKRDGFTREDLQAIGKVALLKKGRDKAILEEVISSVQRWPEFAEAEGIPSQDIKKISAAHRLDISHR